MLCMSCDTVLTWNYGRAREWTTQGMYVIEKNPEALVSLIILILLAFKL